MLRKPGVLYHYDGVADRSLSAKLVNATAIHSGFTNVSAAFDGTTSKTLAASANVSAPAASWMGSYIGQDWGQHVFLDFALIYGVNNNVASFYSQLIRLEGSQDGSSWDILSTPNRITSGVVSHVCSVACDLSASVAYKQHRLNIYGDGSNGIYFAQIEFYGRYRP